MGSNPPKAPLWDGFEAPPLLYGEKVPGDWAAARVAAGEFDKSDFPDLDLKNPAAEASYIAAYSGDDRSPKSRVGNGRDPYNQTSDWNLRMGMFFELGTVFTLIAGLLNVLAIYDAWGGPVGAVAAPHPRLRRRTGRRMRRDFEPRAQHGKEMFHHQGPKTPRKEMNPSLVSWSLGV